MTKPARLPIVLGALIAASGLVLLFELGRSVQWNVRFLDRETLLAPRFTLYLWTGIGVAVLLMMRGLSTARTAARGAWLTAETLLTLIVAGCVTAVVRGMRIRTDVSSADRFMAGDPMPAVLRVLTTGWMFLALLGAVAIALAIALGRAHSRRTLDPTKEGP